MSPSLLKFSLRQHPSFFHQAKKLRGSFFQIYALRLKDELGDVICVAAKKNFPTAVARNRVKRQVKALLSPLLTSTDFVVVVMVYQPINSRQQLQELEHTFLTISA